MDREKVSLKLFGTEVALKSKWVRRLSVVLWIPILLGAAVQLIVIYTDFLPADDQGDNMPVALDSVDVDQAYLQVVDSIVSERVGERLLSPVDSVAVEKYALAAVENMRVSFLMTLDSVLNAIRATAAVPAGESEMDSIVLLLGQFKGEIGKLTDKVEGVEGVLQMDSAHPLAIAALRIELDKVQEKTDAGVTYVRAEIDRIYDFSKWLIGGIALAFLSFALNNWLMRRSIPATVEQTPAVPKDTPSAKA